MLLSRSLMSPTGKERSTRALPSTAPSRWKYPTPLLNSTTWATGSCAEAAGAGEALPAPPFSGPAGEGLGFRARIAARAKAPVRAATRRVRRMSGVLRVRVLKKRSMLGGLGARFNCIDEQACGMLAHPAPRGRGCEGFA